MCNQLISIPLAHMYMPDAYLRWISQTQGIDFVGQRRRIFTIKSVRARNWSLWQGGTMRLLSVNQIFIFSILLPALPPPFTQDPDGEEY